MTRADRRRDRRDALLRGIDEFHKGKPLTDRERMYPTARGVPQQNDPTYGRIDRDIQWHAYEICRGDAPEPYVVSLSRLVALEHTLQDKRNRGETVLGIEQPPMRARPESFVHLVEPRELHPLLVVLVIAVVIAGAVVVGWAAGVRL